MGGNLCFIFLAFAAFSIKMVASTSALGKRVEDTVMHILKMNMPTSREIPCTVGEVYIGEGYPVFQAATTKGTFETTSNTKPYYETIVVDLPQRELHEARVSIRRYDNIYTTVLRVFDDNWKFEDIKFWTSPVSYIIEFNMTIAKHTGVVHVQHSKIYDMYIQHHYTDHPPFSSIHTNKIISGMLTHLRITFPLREILQPEATNILNNAKIYLD
ncbi:uncharacterized protein LOC135387438 [Ornithodoros turicata]|uniref:uncharacterized protein LOC135387438 n=1 Tax=Ornithodoros turicata TaxID=34597 RepID=UPI003138E091